MKNDNKEVMIFESYKNKADHVRRKREEKNYLEKDGGESGKVYPRSR
jgi:hypothetical protein